MKSNQFILLVLLISVMLLSGCFPGDGEITAEKPAGFFLGIWHGWIAPISLILGYFNPDVKLYEQYNAGWRYDFGFYIAIIGGFGGISLIRRKAKKHN